MQSEVKNSRKSALSGVEGRYFLTDALGSTLALNDGGGNILTQYTYEPFGNTTFSGSPNANPFQYTGRENDGTGLATWQRCRPCSQRLRSSGKP